MKRASAVAILPCRLFVVFGALLGCALGATVSGGGGSALVSGTGRTWFADREPIALPDSSGWPDGWRIVDVDGRLAAAGGPGDPVLLPKGLACGWYEIRGAFDPDSARNVRSLAVLHIPPGFTPPVPGLGFNFFGNGASDLPGLLKLGRLAGACEARDGLYSWNWRNPSATDRRKTLAACGLSLTLSTHRTQAGVDADGFGQEFPWDLREAYVFLREAAATLAAEPGATCFEPWNEPDLPRFGGHIGSEIASYQKMAHLAIRAGNPALKVGMAPLSDAHATDLAALEENEVWPYFDSFDIHLYNRQDHASDVFDRLRQLARGKPIRVTECNELLDLHGLAPGAEPSTQALRAQGVNLTKAIARYYGEGAASVDVFRLEEHVEYEWQFGLLRPDSTPRPGYAAVAAAGRFLAGGRCLGRLPVEFQGVTGFMFEALPGGRRRNVLVAWADREKATLDLGFEPDAIFAWHGRALEAPGRRCALTTDPVYIVLPRDKAPEPGLIGVPARARPRGYSQRGIESVCPVVLQAWMPRLRRDRARSAYGLFPGASEVVGLRIYNFSARSVSGSLRVDAPTSLKAHTEGTILLGPGEDADLSLEVGLPPNAPTDRCFSIRLAGDFGVDGRATMTLRVIAMSDERESQ